MIELNLKIDPPVPLKIVITILSDRIETSKSNIIGKVRKLENWM